MKQTINESDFINAFADMGRKDNFSYEGRKALFEYLESYEQDCETEIELDVIALCCEYTECTIDEALKEYNLESIDDLRDNTMVLDVDDETIIYQNY